MNFDSPGRARTADLVFNSECELEFIRIKGKINGLDMSILNYWDISSGCRRSILAQDQIFREIIEAISDSLGLSQLQIAQDIQQIREDISSLKK